MIEAQYMMLTYQQNRKIKNQLRKCTNLYAFLSVLMQMEMSYTNGKSTKVVLGLIADKVAGLESRIHKVLSKATVFDDIYGEGRCINDDDVEYDLEEATIEILKKINQKYSDIRGGCGLIGIKIKNTYSIIDALNYAKRV